MPNQLVKVSGSGIGSQIQTCLLLNRDWLYQTRLPRKIDKSKIPNKFMRDNKQTKLFRPKINHA
jgi:hypothetical protein